MSIKKVGDTNIEQNHRLSCHCGSVVLELHLPNGIVNPRRCDCSICRRKGAVVGSVSLEDISVIKGLEHLRLYQFNTKVAKHYFCGICGIYTHHQRRSFPDQYGYNIGCLEGVDPFLIPRGCTEFCVNGLMTGNRRISRSGYDLKHKESSTQRSH